MRRLLLRRLYKCHPSSKRNPIPSIMHCICILCGILLSVGAVLAASSSAEYRIASGQMLDGMLRQERIPSNIVMRVCWSDIEKIRWHRFAVHPVIFVPVTESEFIVPAFDGLTHRVIVVVDLACDWSADWMANVN